MADILDVYKTFALVGKPGCGKGTQSTLLSKKTHFEIFSSGDKFRELKQKEDFLGRKIRHTIDSGGLMPYWFAGFLFQEAVIYFPHKEGIIFEGSARKRMEAELFHDVMSWLERPYRAIYVHISDEESLKRLLKRAESGSRADDASQEKIETRLKLYYEEVVPAIDYFREQGVLLEIDGEQTQEKVFDDILQKLDSLKRDT